MIIQVLTRMVHSDQGKYSHGIQLFKIMGEVFLRASFITNTAVRYCLIPSYFSQLDYLL